jgi:hypothetical protein
LALNRSGGSPFCFGIFVFKEWAIKTNQRFVESCGWLVIAVPRDTSEITTEKADTLPRKTFLDIVSSCSFFPSINKIKDQLVGRRRFGVPLIVGILSDEMAYPAAKRYL